MMTTLAFARDYITRWEGGLSLNPDDNGNWTGGKKGVGSNRGVTAQALATRRKVDVSAITKATKAAFTLDEAGQIALLAYFYAPKRDKLPWNKWTASIFDMGWGAGPGQSVKLLQRHSAKFAKIGRFLLNYSGFEVLCETTPPSGQREAAHAKLGRACQTG